MATMARMMAEAKQRMMKLPARMLTEPCLEHLLKQRDALGAAQEGIEGRDAAQHLIAQECEFERAATGFLGAG